MKVEEIKEIEQRLNLKLPSHYVAFLRGFEGLKNNEVDLENFLYSSVDNITEANLAIGFHKDDKTIKSKLIIGDNGGGDFYLIDLEDFDNKKVYVFDHEEFSGDVNAMESYDSIADYMRNLKKMFGIIE